MITEDYVSFETAKLLKEKGFDSECRYVYNNDGEKIAAQNFMEGESVVNNYDIERVGETDGWITYLQGSYAFLCPTLQMAMKWLREVHRLSIEPYYDKVLTWVVDIKHIGKHTDTREFKTVRENCYKTYEQACEAAIKYCLENLI